MKLKDLIKKEFRIPFGKKLFIIIFVLAVFIIVATYINTIFQFEWLRQLVIGTIAFLVVLVSLILVYIILYGTSHVYNNIYIQILDKKGKLDDINLEISNLSETKINKAKQDEFLNTENYSIIFFNLLKIFKIEDISRLFKVRNRYSRQVAIEFKNGKQYNISYNSVKYSTELRKIIEKKGIKIKYKKNWLYPFKFFLKALAISFIVVPIVVFLVRLILG